MSLKRLACLSFVNGVFDDQDLQALLSLVHFHTGNHVLQRCSPCDDDKGWTGSPEGHTDCVWDFLFDISRGTIYLFHFRITEAKQCVSIDEGPLSGLVIPCLDLFVFSEMPESRC